MDDGSFSAWIKDVTRVGRGLDFPLEGLRELTALRKTLEGVERELVLAARRNRWSWADIGDALKLSRQAAYARHRPSVSPMDGDSPRSSD